MSDRNRKDPISKVERLSKETLETYEKLIIHLRSRNLDRSAPELPYIGGIPGIKNSYLTMASTYLPEFDPALNRNLLEWNPFTQQPGFFEMRPIKDNISASFRRLEAVARALILFAHEMIHVVLLEPFFTGDLRIRNSSEFVQVFNLFEGFCFFHSDMVVTKSIKLKFPDGKLVYSGNAVSQESFHPLRAFKSIGVTDLRKILEIYMYSFAGLRTELQFADHPLAESLAHRITGFYSISLRPVRRLFATLKETGILTDFQNEFCSRAGMPSLVSAAAAEELRLNGLAAYCHYLHRKGFREIDKLKPEELERIKYRRAIQTRAYFAYQMRHLIKHDWVLPRSRFKPVKVNLLSALSAYIGLLKAALDGLCEGVSVSRVDEDLLKADVFYDSRIRSVFKKKDLWVGKREFFTPYRETFELESSGKIDLSESNRRDAASFLVKALSQKIQNKQKNTARNREALRKIKEVVTARSLEKMMISPWAVKMWSTPLSAVDPRRNRFKEPLFSFE